MLPAPQPSTPQIGPGTLASLRLGLRHQDPAALHAVACEFEAMFLREVLHSSHEGSLAEDSFGSGQGDFYRDIYDEQLANALARGGGIGLGKVIEQQLARAAGAPAASLSPPTPAVGTDRSSLAPLAQAPSLAAAARAWPGRRASALQATAAQAGDPEPEAVAPAAAGGDVDAAPSEANAPPASPTEFVHQLLPYARAAAQDLGIAPAAILAQAALESNWGRRVPQQADGRTTFNLFGIKAGHTWSGPVASVSTLEFADGVAVRGRAAFRAYASLAEGVRDYVTMVKGSPRFRAALAAGRNAFGYLSALAEGGYSTDPAYAQKLHAILGGPLLRGIGP